jgi:hypothetical protein
MKRQQSEAYSDIQPPSMFEVKPKRKARRVSKAEAKEKFAAIHNAVDYSQHIEALRQ